MNNNKDEIVLFENGELALEVNVSPQLETVWLSSNQMALLYGTREQHAKNACCWCQSAGCFL